MARKPKLPPIATDTLIMPPALPDAASLAQCGLPFTREEFDYCRSAMALMATARQPKMSWKSWRNIGGALLLGELYAKRLSGAVEGRAYNNAIGPFLRATGFTFLNAGTRWALRQCALNFEAIEAWRETLPESERTRLHNPIDVWQKFSERDTSNETPVRRRARGARQHRDYATVLEQLEALQELRDDLMARVDYLSALIVDMGGSPHIPPHVLRGGLEPEEAELEPPEAVEVIGLVQMQRPAPMFDESDES